MPFFIIADLPILIQNGFKRSLILPLFFLAQGKSHSLPCTRIRPFPRYFHVVRVSMQRSFEYQSPQFAVNVKFDSFSALKHACTHAALLDVYEFIPDRVDSKHYTLKCKDKECTWHLYASSIPKTDSWPIRTSLRQFKLILVMESITRDTATSMKSLFR